MYEDHYQKIDLLHSVLLHRGQCGQLTSAFTVINGVEASLKADGLLGPLESLRVNAARGALHRRMLRTAQARKLAACCFHRPIRFSLFAEFAALRVCMHYDVSIHTSQKRPKPIADSKVSQKSYQKC
ncbi:hypothetical protein PQQ52_19180 [Paraburkholderia sediminicola]|uniref:hypothetical protein n=1 Tax=Paraburkholderia sediminicola TaxID=458836 RepID=UPI0038BAA880